MAASSSPSLESCCTCATVITSRDSSNDNTVLLLSTKTEKQPPTTEDRRLGCCMRVICGKCIHRNPRFADYCPYCQIATSASNALPAGGLREPPSYDVATSRSSSHHLLENEGGGANPPHSVATPRPAPPPYTPPPTTTKCNDDSSEKTTSPPEEDTLHFLHPTDDTIASLSLRYRVPAPVLRAHNKLPADHLLAARRTLLIPGSHYPAARGSLRPRPVDGEAEEARKAKVRRWMVACKCADYDVAELYLAQAGHDLGLAVEAFRADEEWERRNPLEGGTRANKNGAKSTTKAGRGGTWASQAAFLRRQGSS